MSGPKGKAMLKPLDGKLKVVVRLRPSEKDVAEKEKGCRILPGGDGVGVFSSRLGGLVEHRGFDVTLDAQASQGTVYEAIRESVCLPLKGISSSIIAYGQTGSGKTHTLLNSDGILYRAVRDIFAKIANDRKITACLITCTFLEVYNDRVYDLASTDRQRRTSSLPIRESGGKIHVQGLGVHSVDEPEALLTLLQKSLKNRATARTDSNVRSSRSHAIVQLSFELTRVTTRIPSKGSGGHKVRSQLNIVDLAGSERWGKSLYCGGAMVSAKARKRAERTAQELTLVNSSLSTLGNCISAIGEGRKHIPYRDSCLTRLLESALAGGCQTVLLCTLKSDKAGARESARTLQFAARSQFIVSRLKVEEIIDSDHQLDKMRRQLAALRKHLRAKRCRGGELPFDGAYRLQEAERKRAEAEARIEELQSELLKSEGRRAALEQRLQQQALELSYASTAANELEISTPAAASTTWTEICRPTNATPIPSSLSSCTRVEADFMAKYTSPYGPQMSNEMPLTHLAADARYGKKNANTFTLPSLPVGVGAVDAKQEACAPHGLDKCMLCYNWKQGGSTAPPAVMGLAPMDGIHIKLFSQNDNKTVAASALAAARDALEE